MYSLAFVISNGDGSPEFMRQAEAWRKYHTDLGERADIYPMPLADLPLEKRYAAVSKVIAGLSGELIEQVAFFCHGWPSGIQLVPLNKINQLARDLAAKVVSSSLLVTLYCCSTASDTDPKTPEMQDTGTGGDGGFADLLRDALCAQGFFDCQVDAHTTAGHTTQNPYVRRFEGHGIPTGGVGGQWIVTPRSKQWAKWSAALKKGTFRFAFPFQSMFEIHTQLDK